MRDTTCSGRERRCPVQPTKRAQDEQRIVVTFDKDFGELAFRSSLPASSGVVIFRLQTQSPEHVQKRVLETFAQRTEWNGHLFVVEEHRLRVRPLPELSRDDTDSEDH